VLLLLDQFTQLFLDSNAQLSPVRIEVAKRRRPAEALTRR
jgi:hypothetical protein